MGDVWGDGGPDERPVHAATVASFLLGKYAVTNSQFACFLNDAAPSGGDGLLPALALVRPPAGPIEWTGARFVCRARCERWPATYVSWYGASAYCAWLSARVGRPVRLPSEVEWQYASLGPRGVRWAGGDTFERSRYVCGCDGPAPVDWGEPSDWGLFNLTGNVFEWVHDEYRCSLDASDPGARLPQNRVIKGGAFILSDSANLRNARRFSCHERSRLSCIGFRVAADAGQA